MPHLAFPILKGYYGFKPFLLGFESLTPPSRRLAAASFKPFLLGFESFQFPLQSLEASLFKPFLLGFER